MSNEMYMTVSDICALSFHECWDKREDYFAPGVSLPESTLRKWIGLKLVEVEQFASNNSHGYTIGIPVSQIPKIRELFDNPPNTRAFPKVTRASLGFITWCEYMNRKKEKHV